jgi:hypothetical protein
MAGHSIFGIYTSRQGVEAAVQALRDADFRSSDISVLAPENLGDIRDIATVKSTKAPEGATAGGASGAVVGGVGAAVGGLTGALVGFGVPEFEAKRYETRLKKGGILISVHADNHDWISRAKAILEKTGAEDVSSATESRVA